MKLTTTLQLTTYLKLIERRVNQEWFRLNSTVLSTIKKKLETFQINLQVLKDVTRRCSKRNNNGGATRYFEHRF
jgi:hypothetical protein